MPDIFFVICPMWTGFNGFMSIKQVKMKCFLFENEFTSMPDNTTSVVSYTEQVLIGSCPIKQVKVRCLLCENRIYWYTQ